MDDAFRNQPVLVTGGSGFIGSHVTRRLVALGAQVHILVRESSDLWRLQDIPSEKISVWRSDLKDYKTISDCVHQIKPRRLFHLGAMVNAERNFEFLEEMIDVNLKGTLGMIEALKELGCDCFINVGTSEEYGNGSVPFDEGQRESPVSPYSASKVAAAYFCQMIHQVSNFPVITTRPFLTYGPYQLSDMLIPSLIGKCLRGEKEFAMTPGEQTREFNYVDDVVEKILRVSLCQELIGEIVNIGNSQEHKIIDVARLIVKLTGSSLELKAGALPYRSGEVFHFYGSTEKLSQKVKSLPFTPLEEGLRKTIKWYSEYLKDQSAS